MKLRLLRDFLPRPLPLKIFIPRSFGHSADTSYPSTNQDREARRHSDKAEHPNPAPIGHFYRFLCRAVFSWQVFLSLVRFDGWPRGTPEAAQSGSLYKSSWYWGLFSFAHLCELVP